MILKQYFTNIFTCLVKRYFDLLLIWPLSVYLSQRFWQFSQTSKAIISYEYE